MVKNIFIMFGLCLLVFTGCKPDESVEVVKGCMDPNSSTYNPAATEDDGSCKYSGCTDPKSLNYNPQANVDDGSCKAPKEEQMSLMVKLSGTACPPCGGWGWTMYEQMRTDMAGKAIPVVAFSDNFVADLFITDVAEDWDVQQGANSYPSFVANGTRKSGNTIDQIQQGVYSEINAKNAMAPIANVGFISTREGNTLKIKAQTKFFQDATGEYYTGIYVVENEVEGKQSGHPDYPKAVKHHDVLRAAADDASWGKMVASGTIAAGSTYDQDFTITIDDEWNMEHVQLFAVVWKKLSTKYFFVNTAYELK